MSKKYSQKDGNMNNLIRDHASQPSNHGHQGQYPGYYQGNYMNSGYQGNLFQQHGVPVQKMAPQNAMGHNYGNTMNYKQYRDSRPKSPPKAAVPPTTKDYLNDFDDQPGGYKDDRIQNELLSEICSDFGIDDAMDLDIFDFDAPPESFCNMYPTRLSDFGTPDQSTPFSDFPGQDQYGMTRKKPGFEEGNGGQYGGHHRSSMKVPSSTTSGPGTDPAEYSPYTHSVPSVKSLDQSHDAAVDSPTVSSSVPSANDAHQQPIVSSSRPESIGSSMGSPSVHSTTPSLNGPYDSLIKQPSSVDSSLKAPGSVESSYSVPSPSSSGMAAMQRARQRRQDSVDSQGSLHRSASVGSPMSPAVSLTNHSSHSGASKHSSMENLVGSPSDADKTVVDLTSDDRYTSNFKSDTFTCYSQPASPAKGKMSNQLQNGSVYKAQSMNDNLHRHAIQRLQSQQHDLHDVTLKAEDLDSYESHTDDEKQKAQIEGGFKVPHGPVPPNLKTERSASMPSSTTLDQGYSSIGSPSVISSSHYGSSTNLSHASNLTDNKEEVRRFINQEQNSSESNLEVFSMPSTADLNIPTLHSDTPSNSSSQSNSPTTMHVAKRARVINSGSDLLEEIRDRYSFTKGADMYAPSQYPQIPVQRVRPTPQMQPSYQMSGMNADRVQMQTQVPSQFNFSGVKQESGYPPKFIGPGSQTNNLNMNNNTQGGMNPPPLQRRQMYGGSGSNSMQQQMNSGYLQSDNMQKGMYSNNNTSQYPSQSAMDNMAPNQGQNTPQQGMHPVNMQNNPNMQMNNMQNGNMNRMGPNNMHMGNTPGSVPGDMNMQMNSAQGPQSGMVNSNMPMNMRAPVAGARMSNTIGPSSMGTGQMPPYHQNYSAAQNSMGGNSMDSNMNTNQRSYDGSYGPNQYQSHGNQSQYGTSQQQQSSSSGMGSYDNYPGNNPNNYRSQSPSMAGYGGMPNQQTPAMNAAQMGGNMVGNRPGMMDNTGPNNNMPPHMSGGNLHMSGGPYNSSNSNGPPMGGGTGSLGGISNISGLTPGGGFGTTSTGRLKPPPEGLMQQIISDRSSAFRTHPLFPLLRDLIIADMNFHTPSFPFQLIANLPADFDKLLQNYLNRNPPARNMPPNPAIEQVIMDALKYAHQSLIDKIQVKKTEVGYQETPKPLSAIEDFCERFDRAVKNSMSKPGGGPNPSKPLNPPKTPSKSSQGAAPVTPKKDPKEGSGKTDSEKTGGSTPTGKTGTAGRNKVLPKEAVALMLDWLREHQDNPYPNDDEKEMLISKTKLTINQINYWFTNARRRILPKWALQRYMEQQQHSPFGPRLTPM